MASLFAPSIVTTPPQDGSREHAAGAGTSSSGLASFLHRRRSGRRGSAASASTAGSPSPSSGHTHATGIELAAMGGASAPAYRPRPASIATMATTTSTLASEAPPAYDALYAPLLGAGGAPGFTFTPTLQLQIDTAGKARLSLPLPPSPLPTTVHVVGAAGGEHAQPALVSLRQTRSSGTCALVAGPDYAAIVGSAAAAHGDVLRTLSTTTYRFGPGRPPRIALFSPSPEAFSAGSPDPWDAFEVVGTSLLSRTQQFRTRLGTFSWRYGGRAERKALTKALAAQPQRHRHQASNGDDDSASDASDAPADPVNNLLVLDRVVRVFGAVSNGAADGNRQPPASLGGPREIRRPVARLIRSPALRAPGSSASTAGNGGRLQLDLSEWMAEAAADSKGGEPVDQAERDLFVVLAVTTVLCMLKKEVDRCRGQQIAVLAAISS